MIINDAQKKMDNFVKGSDFIDLKSSVYNLNKENENKINELNSLCGDLENKLTEMRKENESYQKFTLEKMKQIQKDSMETRLQQQNELIKMEDAKDNRINAQLSQLKNLISINDKNIKEEQEYRKTMINDLRNETLNIFAEKDDQLSKLERNQLETEKNLISLNKDYIQSFNAGQKRTAAKSPESSVAVFFTPFCRICLRWPRLRMIFTVCSRPRA